MSNYNPEVSKVSEQIAWENEFHSEALINKKEFEKKQLKEGEGFCVNTVLNLVLDEYTKDFLETINPNKQYLTDICEHGDVAERELIEEAFRSLVSSVYQRGSSHSSKKCAMAIFRDIQYFIKKKAVMKLLGPVNADNFKKYLDNRPNKKVRRNQLESRYKTLDLAFNSDFKKAVEDFDTGHIQFVIGNLFHQLFLHSQVTIYGQSRVLFYETNADGRKKLSKQTIFSEAFIQLLDNLKDSLKFFVRSNVPMLIPPTKWKQENLSKGGFLTHRIPLVNNKHQCAAYRFLSVKWPKNRVTLSFCRL